MSMNFAQARDNMVDGQIRTSDVTDSALIAAMRAVPRELFVPEALRPVAYQGESIEVAPGRRLLDPRVFAKLAQLAEIKAGDRVLDLGAATGYSTAVFARLAATVVAVDPDAALTERARALLAELNVANATTLTGALPDGAAAQGPFDVIFINGAVDEPGERLMSQLATGGRLVAVVTDRGVGKAHVFLKSAASISGRVAFDAAISQAPGFQRAPAFTF